ncbi:phosphoglycerate kinase [Acuticoccus sp. MNP-M23]|uniref:phosphoglycerate kinase n=1 Tax=Acuticoccus sp. MNP-M23 TaxID=3072793 RepID=UPI00281506CE|nr:phosphoglycerate kinase [Acuticoccus sp. MNP-M23]WMS43211.1 phosphoglycerate kinase [Acuticoccus sp. MNP-M23]
MNILGLDEIGDVAGKRVLVRVDLNVPMADGKIGDRTRIHAVAPTITELSDAGAKVILLAHFGRPKGERNDTMSLRPIAEAMAEEIGRKVAFAEDCVGEAAASAVADMDNGAVLLLENTRFHGGEEKNDADFADALAKNGDLYVNDAFSAAHRAHGSTEGLAHRLPAFAGRSMESELAALTKALGEPKRPVMAVVGGAKVSTKIALLENLVTKVDALVVGGGMANTFLHAMGIDVGHSLKEADQAETARRIMSAAEKSGCAIMLPHDAMVAEKFEAGAEATHVGTDEGVDHDKMILDVGPRTVEAINNEMNHCATLVWNGPLGAFEIPPFDKATVACARHAAMRTKAGLLSVAGGGDTVAALVHAGVANEFSYLSTAGGAFLEWLEGKPLPGVEALKR